MWAHPVTQDLFAYFCLGSLVLPTAQSSMGLTQPTWTYHTLLSPLRLVQQETLSVWYWGSNWTLQLCTTTLCLQLVEMSLWQCKGTSQYHNAVSTCMWIHTCFSILLKPSCLCSEALTVCSSQECWISWNGRKIRMEWRLKDYCMQHQKWWHRNGAMILLFMTNATSTFSAIDPRLT